MLCLAVWAEWVVLPYILGLYVLHFMWVWLQRMLVYCCSLYLSDMDAMHTSLLHVWFTGLGVDACFIMLYWQAAWTSWFIRDHLYFYRVYWS